MKGSEKKRNVRKVVTSANYVVEPSKRTVITGKSETIQGDGETVGQLLNKLVKGMPVAYKAANWADEEMNHENWDLEAFTKMDRIDQEYVIEGMKEMAIQLKKYQEKEASEVVDEEKEKKEKGDGAEE